MYIYIYIYMYTHVYAYVSICIYICLCVCIYIYIYIYAYILLNVYISVRFLGRPVVAKELEALVTQRPLCTISRPPAPELESI